jgi:hypothetical protein
MFLKGGIANLLREHMRKQFIIDPQLNTLIFLGDIEDASINDE